MKRIASVLISGLMLALTMLYLPNQNIAINTVIEVYAADGRLYNQWDSKWASVVFDKYATTENSLKVSGCGIFSFCNALYALNGTVADPVEIATWAVNIGAYQPGNGGLWRYPFYNSVESVFGSRYGFRIDGYQNGSVTDSRLISHLQNNGVAVINVPGHFMAITGYNASNKTYHVIESAVANNRGLQADSWVSAEKMCKGDTNVQWYALISSTDTPTEFFDFWGVEDGITVNDTYKIWLKQVGLGDATNSDVNIYIDGKELQNCLGTIYQDDGGFYSIAIDTTNYNQGSHTLYAVFRNTAGKEIWVSRNLVFKQDYFFDFWGVDDGTTVGDTYKIWFKQEGLGDATNSDVNIYIDGKELNNHLATIYQDENGYFSYELDTTKYAFGKHTIYAVFRNTAGKEIWVSRNLVFKQDYFFDFWGVNDGTTVGDTYKIWFKQEGLGNATNSDVNIYIDGKELSNHITTIYQDENGFYSYTLNTIPYGNGEHTIYAVFRNTSEKEIWVNRTLNVESDHFFNFWGVDDEVQINGRFKVWFRQIGYPLNDTTNVQLFVDSTEMTVPIDTLYQDENGFFSYELDTYKFDNGQHTLYAVLKSSPEEVCVSKAVIINNNYGDCNNDGEFNVADVILLQKWLLAVPNIHIPNWQAADLCKDDKLDVFDLCLMKQKLIYG